LNSKYFCVIGFGHIGKKHVEEILAHPFCELTAIIENSPENYIQAQNRYGEKIPIFKHFNEFLNANVFNEIISICIPNGLHAKYATLSLKHGYHVLVEKPICLNSNEGNELIQLAELFNRNIFVVKQNRFSPSVKWMKSIVDLSIIGKIQLVQINCFWNRDDRYYKKGSWRGTKDLDGGPLYTQFSHFIDIMYWVFGDIQDIEASFYKFNSNLSTEFEDSGIVKFKFNKGGLGTFNFSTAIWNANFESSITVIGEKGTFKIGGQYMNKIEYCHIQDYSPPTIEENNFANNYGDYTGSASNHFQIYDNVVMCLNGKEQIAIDARDGVKVVEIIEKIMNSKK